ncbi:MAG: nucleotidyltransferase domain-containing protein [Alphaproteobacteria bacterium]|nr:nucleotidyltransferase domain-containing protein [Alphaproteobacteria bacterium]
MISKKRDLLIAACKRFDIVRLDIFGSAARGIDFDPTRSDVDFLVAFRPDAKVDCYLDLEEAFESILGRKVDLMDRRTIETSRNYIRRRSILEHAEPIYVE